MSASVGNWFGKWLLRVVVVTIAGAGATSGYFWLRGEVAVGIYEERLDTLLNDYDMLRARYNDVVRKTAITELVVRNGRLSVVVRSVDGPLETIPTPFDPAGEIYVDYVVIDGRLWIRRVFDAGTPPSQGVLVDPGLAHVDWQSDGAEHGKAVYRQLSEGNWLVTVTGNGALGLTQSDVAAAGELQSAPALRNSTEIAEAAKGDLREIGPRDVLHQVGRMLDSTE